MKKIKRLIVTIITVVLVLGMLAGNITFAFAQSSDLSVNIEKLEKLYNEKKDIKRGTYTHSSWMYFQDALHLAKQVLDHKDEMNEETVEWAFEYLSSARLDEHDGSSVNYSPLEDAYNKYKGVKQGNFNQVSWKHFTDILEEARLMLYEYELIHQGNLDLTLKLLEEAYDGLKEGEPDFTQLEKVYNQYKDLEQGDYNLGSWSMFKQKLNWVKNLLTDLDERESTTQSYINSELKELLTAVERLETGVPDLTELEQLFDQFNAKYKNINPEEFLTDQEDIELFQTIMYHVPIYLYDFREEATHYETEELIQSIKELQIKLTNTNDDDANSKGEHKSTQGGNNGSKEDKLTQGGNNGSKEEDDNTIQPYQQNNGDNDLDSNSNTSKNQVTDKNDLENNLDASNKTLQESILGNLLPNTSTNYYNMMVLGLIIIVEGVFLYLYFNFLSFLRRRFNLF